MDSFVYSALGPRKADLPVPSPLLERAMAHAAAEEWRAAHDVLRQAQDSPADRRAAHFLLWEVCQVLGDRDAALASLRVVLEYGPVTSRASAAPRRRILVLAVPGDFQANLPIGALLDTGTELHTLWLSDPDAVLADPSAAFGTGRSSISRPPFESVFIAIAEDARHARALQAADRLAAWLDVPVINGGSLIAAVSRVGAARLLQDLPDAIVPAQSLLHRTVLEAQAAPAPADRARFPMIVRPNGSHAGKDLERLDDAPALRRYLDRVGGQSFHVAPFVDYRSGDGLWRKYRIIFVAGRPWPYHLAIHSDWAIWYYNARMDLDPWKRDEEAAFLADIGRALPGRALAALHAIGARIGLDYFGMDCGIAPDGRLVVFEIETGMIVHDWEAPDLYPYKSGSVQRIRRATEAMIDARVEDRRRKAA